MVYKPSMMYQPSSIPCLCLLIILVLLQHNGCSACFQLERDALLELKASITWDATYSSSPFLTWVNDQTSDCCVWKRVECHNITHRVVGLDLNRALNGLLNASLFLSFQHLHSLDLSNNGITGWLPNEGLERFSHLSNLEYLNMGSNLLNESSLASLSAVTSLKDLNLYFNVIQRFPEGICGLEKLEKLDLAVNLIEGIIHPCILHNLTHLMYLDLSSNQLTGIIPPYLLSNMTSLEFISLSGNHLDGNALMMPSLHPQTQLSVLCLSNCSINISTTHLLKFLRNQYSLKKIDLSRNMIYGNYPNWLVKNNTRLEFLILSNNLIDGFIYFPLGFSKNMVNIDIANNKIQGQLQTNIGDVFPNLVFLSLSRNCLEGRIPTSLGNITNLSSLFLSSNNFSGDLSPLFQTLNATHLSYFDVSDNQFTGYFSSNNIYSNNMISLNLGQNYITGRIPIWMANFTNLQFLYLEDNLFNGFFPSEFCNLQKLLFMDVSKNELSGLLPSCFNLTSLNYMHLERNKFSGVLPVAILNSMYLQTLDLSYNYFTGAIPKWLQLLPMLSLLLLRGNLLSGNIPQELCELKKIDILDISSNKLSGFVPPCLNALSFGKLWQRNYPFYTGDIPYYYSNWAKREEVELITKSKSEFYKGYILDDMASMDLSNNHFIGDIPPEFGALIDLRALNLSYNNFTGSIPKALSNMKKLESMDLSHNKLTGEIPIDLIGISTLEVFSVAYNNLSGRLPDMKAQFSTFIDTSYQGNKFLCGPPLQTNCISNNKRISGPEETIKPEELWDKYGINPISFLASFVVTYIMYLMGFVTVLYINPCWRRNWFYLIDICINFVFTFYLERVCKRSNACT